MIKTRKLGHGISHGRKVRKKRSTVVTFGSSRSIERIKIDEDRQLTSTSEEGEIAYVSSQVTGEPNICSVT